jgi:hypothetical protein
MCSLSLLLCPVTLFLKSRGRWPPRLPPPAPTLPISVMYLSLVRGGLDHTSAHQARVMVGDADDALMMPQPPPPPPPSPPPSPPPPPLMTPPLHGRGRSVRRAARARLAVMATDTRLLVVACPCSLHSVYLLRPLPRSEAAF